MCIHKIGLSTNPFEIGVCMEESRNDWLLTSTKEFSPGGSPRVAEVGFLGFCWHEACQILSKAPAMYETATKVSRLSPKGLLSVFGEEIEEISDGAAKPEAKLPIWEEVVLQMLTDELNHN